MLRHNFNIFIRGIFIRSYLKKNSFISCFEINHSFFLYFFISLYCSHFKCDGAEEDLADFQTTIEASSIAHERELSETISQGVNDQKISPTGELEELKKKDLLSEAVRELEETETDSSNVYSNPQGLLAQQTTTEEGIPLLCGISSLFNSSSNNLSLTNEETEQPLGVSSRDNKNSRKYSEEMNEDSFQEITQETKRLIKETKKVIKYYDRMYMFPDTRFQESFPYLKEDLKKKNPLLVYHELIKFNEHSIKKLKDFTHYTELIITHQDLEKRVSVMIQKEIDLMCEEFRKIKEKLDVKDECKVSIKCKERHQIVLRIINPEKSIGICFALEKGTVPYKIKESWYSSIRHMLREESNYFISTLIFWFINPQEEEDSDEYSWNVKASNFSFALDKLADANRQPLKYIDLSLGGYSEIYINDRYFFSQVLRDFFQIRPSSSISELRDKCSSNTEIAEYFFSKAEHLPGYRFSSIL